jgi:hypothetical protein
VNEQTRLLKIAIKHLKAHVQSLVSTNRNMRTGEIDDPDIKAEVDELKGWLKDARRLTRG